jgi:chloride channel 3/4/5
MVDMPVRNDAADYGLCYDSPNAYGYAAAMWLLFITALVRATLTTITFGLRIPAGVFIPTMVVGACVGRILGMIVAEVSGQAVTPATYALIGAASTLSGVSRSTIAMAVIIFELTGGAALLFVVPVMVCLI